ncbi:oxidoreductase [Haematobacter missouriensis]|uniref:NAD(P)-dependent oxidoreductase n=1 Tax=Haematobacter missouriensis TaxID=366616 RepID=A0A212AU30_9RHOB|nr:SDR family oxidoreductase [Haematobacter missouriensis]KFI33249.1 oxidoreductase [Haematobacter missouriensis]OWJ75756.1 NAD(P)-dependent oxidoreductase [Haematobacter missouriensis]OWJ84945.1 NAD(P)-dependent oxidoreductase [Haematobacter missouriensis]
MSFSIAGKTAIVTGTATGLGLAIARHFVERGANVMFAEADEQRLLSRVGNEVDADSGPLRFFVADTRRKLAVTNLISATYDAFERVDILVNAGFFMQPSEDVLDPECDGVEELWQTNVLPALRLSQQVARRMVAQTEADALAEGEAGSIITLSSIAARRTRPEMLAASIAASGVEQVTRSLALALAPKRIRVNALALGSVMTETLQGAIRETPDYRDEVISHTPTGRIAGAREVVEAVQFLASEAASFMTGEVLTLDGGRSLLDTVPFVTGRA